MIEGNLKRLRELTESLSLSNLTPDYQIGDAYHYEFNGKAITHGLCHTSEIAVAKLEMEKGTVFPEHSHVMLEVFIVLDGKLLIRMENESWTVTRSQPLYIIPNIPHSAEAITDVTALCITVPADAAFPHPVGNNE